MILHHADPCKFRGIGKNKNKPEYTLGTKWTFIEQKSKMY